MADIFTVKFTNGATSFEVQGTNQEWVDSKIQELKELADGIPVVTEHAAPVQQSKKSSKRTTSTRKTTTRSTSQANDTAGQLESKWDDSLAEKIDAFVAERQKAFGSSAPKQAAILAVFFEDTLDIKGFSASDFQLVYRKLGWKTINHVTQLNNAYTRDKFFSINGGTYELTHTGRVFGRDTSKDKA